MMQKRHTYVALVVSLVFLASCAGVELKNPAEMTPKERATFAMKLFVKQAQDVQALEKQPLTPEIRALVEQKKALLKQAAVVIDLYNGYIDGGLKPTPAMEAQLLDVINQLLIK